MRDMGFMRSGRRSWGAGLVPLASGVEQGEVGRLSYQ